ncbi:MAG: PQQ-binding-like beta-propeller repeat protein [Lentisphaeria bacterium]|nr:PQQ-binding-like beta-propeller repeat protein [Lentisphaeria bacterium]
MKSKLLAASVLFVWIAAAGFAAEVVPLHDWRLGQLLVPDASGTHYAQAEGRVTLETTPVKAMVFDGESTRLVLPNTTSADLPKRAMTIEMCVMPKHKVRWGGIVGYFQDNGAYEKGWLLGYENDRFSFALASVKGPGRMTYLKSPQPFTLGRWYHVAAVYDGALMRLYVNGRKVAESAVQKGAIDYPPKAWYTIGSYRDDNENFLFKGKLHSLSIFAEALPKSAILAHIRPLESLIVQPLAFAAEPRLRFLPGGAASVRWDLAGPATCDLEYQPAESADLETRSLTSDKSAEAHEVVLRGLRARTRYTYRIRASASDGERLSKTFSFDTAFDYTLPPVQEVSLAPAAESAAAREIVEAMGTRRGLCVVYGLQNGRLAYEIARQSEMTVVGVDDDPRRVAAARKFLAETGVYGIQASVRQAKDLGALPMPSGLADLVVSEAWFHRRCPGTAKEVRRLLRPGGGQLQLLTPKQGLDDTTRKRLEAWLGHAVAKGAESARFLEWSELRIPLADVGSWTHQYGDAGNSANSWDAVGGAGGTNEMVVQWLGKPGADFGIDRNPRMPAPLASRGILFHQGMNRLVAINAWNGVILWSLEMPALRRVNMPHDCGNWCLDDDTLYLAGHENLFLLDSRSGQEKARLTVPAKTDGSAAEWGYVGREGKLIVGSRVPRGATCTEYWGSGAWYDAKLGKGTEKVCSQALFAFDASGASATPVWIAPGEAIINSSITLGGGRVFYLESRNPVLKGNTSGKCGDALWTDLDLVCLETASGKEIWRQAAEIAPGKIVLYMSWVAGNLVLVSSSDGFYHLYCHNPETGKRRWENQHAWPSDNHSGHMQHPVLNHKTVFLVPHAYDLETGKRWERNIGKRGGCATYTGTRNALIYRGQGGRVAMWDIASGKVTSWTNLRPSCWISTVPACGLVLSPEGSGGCSCGTWLETSLGFAPKSLQSQGE